MTTRNDMPKRGIQDLRDELLMALDVKDPEFNGYGNMIENVLTTLQRMGRILWQSFPEDRVLAFTSDRLRAAADQLEAFQKLNDAGADLIDIPSPLSVHGDVMGQVWWTDPTPVLAISTAASNVDWLTKAEFYRAFPGDDSPYEGIDDDNE